MVLASSKGRLLHGKQRHNHSVEPTASGLRPPAAAPLKRHSEHAYKENKRAREQLALGAPQLKLMADLLLVDGNPLANIKLIEDPANNFLVIMKDGAIYKNRLP